MPGHVAFAGIITEGVDQVFVLIAVFLMLAQQQKPWTRQTGLDFEKNVLAAYLV